MTTALHNLQLISDGVITTGKAILIDGEKIINVVDEFTIPQDTNSFDLQGAYVAPGLIDLQVYGSGGKLFGGKYTTDALKQMEQDFLAQGTTGFLATIGTNSPEVFEDAIVSAKLYKKECLGNFIGLHLEGPFLNPERKGAHLVKFMRKVMLAEMQKWLELGDDVIKMMTVAPELQDEEVLNYLNDHGIILSSGHSNATYQQGKSFLNNPVKAVTHLFNAMPQMHHREPGYIPAIFEERPYTSIVNDGIHVDFAMVRLAKRELGNKLFFITDAVTAATEGTYQHQFSGDRYTMPDGTLSGSCLTMLKAVQNGVEQVGIALAEAINMASLYPAQLASLTLNGKISAGYNADMIVFNSAFEIQGTVFKGNYLTKST